MKVSVLVCNYNHGKYIAQCIEGVINQTYRNLELIIIDDCSTDDSVEVVKKYSDKDPRIKLYKNVKNIGVLDSFKIGFEKCNSPLFMSVSADDYLTDNTFFQTANDLLYNNPRDASGVYALARRVDGVTGNFVGVNGCGVEGYIPAKEFEMGFFGGKYFVPGYSVIWKKKKILEVGGYDYSLGPQTDYYINHLLPSLSGIYFLSKMICSVRIFDINFSSSASVEEKIIRHAKFERLLLKKTEFKDRDLIEYWRTKLINDLTEGKNIDFYTGKYMKELNEL